MAPIDYTYPQPRACVGCGWDGYTHTHTIEDGPRELCCAHTCGKDAPAYQSPFVRAALAHTLPAKELRP